MYQISEGSIDPCSLTFDKLQVVFLIIPFNSETRSVVYSFVFVGGSVWMLAVGHGKVAHIYLWGHRYRRNIVSHFTFTHFVLCNQS